MSATVIELAPFRLAEGTAEQALFEASEALQSEFLAKQPGFVRRELLQLDAEQWCDLVYWENDAAAGQAVEAAASSPTCLEYFRLMADASHDDPAQGVQHLSIRRSYSR